VDGDVTHEYESAYLLIAMPCVREDEVSLLILLPTLDYNRARWGRGDDTTLEPVGLLRVYQDVVSLED